MRLFITLLAAMSLAGTLPFLLCEFIFHTMKKRRFPASFQYAWQKGCIALYLLPLPLLKHLLFPAAAEPASFLSESGGSPALYIPLDNAIHLTAKGFALSLPLQSQLFLIAVWCAGVFLAVLFTCLRLRRFRKRLGILCPVSADQETLQRQKESLGIRRRVALYECPAFVSPFTCGVFRPAILLTFSKPERARNLVLRHELTHIKSNDALVRLLALFAVFLHWYNPAVYVFFRELKKTQELACDERLSKTLSKEEKREYGALLLDTAAAKTKTRTRFLPFSGSGYAFLQKRICCLCHPAKAGLLPSALLSLVLAGAACVPILCFAPKTLNWRNAPGLSGRELTHADGVSYAADLSDVPADERTFLYQTEYLTDADGAVIHPFAGGPPAACSEHTFYPVWKKQHAKKSAGCLVTTRQISFCLTCGYEKPVSAPQQIFYLTCPHKQEDAPALSFVGAGGAAVTVETQSGRETLPDDPGNFTRSDFSDTPGQTESTDYPDAAGIPKNQSPDYPDAGDVLGNHPRIGETFLDGGVLMRITAVGKKGEFIAEPAG